MPESRLARRRRLAAALDRAPARRPVVFLWSRRCRVAALRVEIVRARVVVTRGTPGRRQDPGDQNA